MSKPRKPFMIEVGNDLIRITPKGNFRLVSWEGSKFLTREEAQEALDKLPITGANIIEVIDEIRARF